MARSKVVLPPDSTGQAMGVTTYSNGVDTVAAPETVLVSTTGTPITPTTPSDTQPVSAASLPLPSGAATAAKQPALGTAGSASADVLSVQGVASMTALKVDASATTQPISGTVTVQDGGGAISIDDNGGTVSIDDGGGSVTVDGTVGVSGTVTVDSELTTADLDTGAGTDTRAVVGLVYGGSGGGTLVSTTDPLPIGDNGGSLTVDGTFWQATQPVSGTVTASQGGAPWADNVTQLGGTAIDTNSGTKSAGTQRVVLATDQPQLTNALKVDGSATTQPVSGTFWQATQPVSGTVTANAGSGTLAVSLAAGATAPAKAEDAASADADVGVPAMAVRKATPANTSGTDGDYEMLQMSAGRLWTSATIDAALPAGTAAIGKLAANDGVDVGDVTINNASGASAVNVQDGGNSLTVDNGGTFAVQDSQVVADNAGFTDGTTKVFAAGFIFDEVAGTALTENDAAAGRIDSKRAQVGVLEDATTRGQRAAVSAGGALKVDNSAVTQPVSGTFWQATQPVSLAATVTVDSELPAAAALNGTIAKSVSTPVVGAALLVSDNTNFVQPLGDAANGLDVDVTRLPALVAGSATIGNVGLAPATSGGLSISRTLSANNTTGINAKASAGQVYGWYISNTNASARFVKLYNKATAPTVGTDTPVMTIVVPGSATGAGTNVEFTNGIAFATGIGYGITAAIADNDTTAPAANEVVVNLLYK